ncbi:MAG: LCP family protein [Coriobacteriaceae bacterium]|jgi:LCP family protein required for cell wall assembly|nr:LCP family protein [Coriobacteriaceae bacterium]
MIGSHVVRPAPKAAPKDSHQPALKPTTFQRTKKAVIAQVDPESSSRESDSAFARRLNRPHYTKTLQRKARVKASFIVAAVLIAITVVAVTVGIFVYLGSVGERMALKDPATRGALTKAEADKPFYTLLMAEFSEPGKEYTGPSVLILLRLDQASQKATLVSIPPNLQVLLSDGEYHRLADAQLIGGDRALVKAVSEFCGVPIAHLIKTDKEGFVAAIDFLGGISLEVSEEVDDPRAGPLYIPAGWQDLDGEGTLVLCRASNYLEGEVQRAQNQRKVVTALADKLLEKNALGLVFAFDGLAGHFETDLGLGDFITLVDGFRGLGPADIDSIHIPGYAAVSTLSDIRYFYVDDADWQLMRTAMVAGEKPSEAIPKPEPVDHGSFEIIVRNGSGVAGGAKQIADILTADGYVVKEIGNADLFVYEETLVVYDDDAYAPAAQTVVDSLGLGRAIPSNTFYSFDSHVLVVVGKDWKPLN